jgi:hypothetical protein
MKLIPTDWVEPEIAPVTVDKEKWKTEIKNFVTTPKTYDQIVDHLKPLLQADGVFVSREKIKKFIELVREEWYPPEEPPEEPPE